MYGVICIFYLNSEFVFILLTVVANINTKIISNDKY